MAGGGRQAADGGVQQVHSGSVEGACYLPLKEVVERATLSTHFRVGNEAILLRNAQRQRLAGALLCYTRVVGHPLILECAFVVKADAQVGIHLVATQLHHLLW